MILVLAAVFPKGADAQLNMERSTFTAPFAHLDTTAGATKITWLGDADEGVALSVPIGFSFNYLGISYTSFSLSPNGWISFNSIAGAVPNNGYLFAVNSPNLTIAPWWDDLVSPKVWYKTTGTPGSRVFTLQWFEALSATIGSPSRNINFQLWFHEGTNVIEFWYGPISGSFNPSESASIGMENALGGGGNWLDAVSGSSVSFNATMNTNKWPQRHFRFTPGSPTPLAGGTYTVGLAGTFPNLSEAVATLNNSGISGPVVLSLLDANYDTTVAGGQNIFPIILSRIAGNSAANTLTLQPASGTSTLRYRGVANGSFGNFAGLGGTTDEPILGVFGTDYLTVRNIHLVSESTSSNDLVDRGLLVFNSSATDGSTNNLFENLFISIPNTSNAAIGLQQRTITAPTSALGANSNNVFRNLTIDKAYSGIFLVGNPTYPDINCQIGTSSPTTYNIIGGPAPFSLGSGTVASSNYGIRISNQSGAKVFNNQISNVGTLAGVDGILVEAAQGVTEVYNNRISGLRNGSTTSLAVVTGIRASVFTTGTHSLRIYNNSITGLSIGYTGSLSAGRSLKGIHVQSTGGGTTAQSINVDANNVRMENTSLNCSSACYEIGTVTGPVINTRNNIFADFTAAQTSPACHVGFQTPSLTLLGNTGSVSNYNDFFIYNTTRGAVGQGNTTFRTTLGNWQASYVGQDVNSVSADPGYFTSTDLHASGGALHNVGNLASSTWVTTDFDNEPRSVTPDIGADEFALVAIDMRATLLTAPPLPPACYSAAEPCSVTIANNGGSTIDFAVTPTTVTVNVTGAVTATLSAIVSSGTLAPGATRLVYVGTVNMSAIGTYVLNGQTSVAGDGVPANDAFGAVSIAVTAGTVSASKNYVCAGQSVTLASLGASASTFQWQRSTDNGLTWANETAPGSTTASCAVTPTDTTLYRMMICGVHVSLPDTVIWKSIPTPVVVADTVCGTDSITLTASAGTALLNWYATPAGGTPLATGPSYSDFISSTTTYYVQALNDGTVQHVGLSDNSLGGTYFASSGYQIFSVIDDCVLMGVYIYPATAGTAVLEWRTSTGALIQSSNLIVTAADVGQKTWFPLGWNLLPGTNYQLARGSASVNLFRVGVVPLSYPYTIPGLLAITNSSSGTSVWCYSFDWQIANGCLSPLVPVTAVSQPAVPISLSPSVGDLCFGDSLALAVTSSDPSYAYSWEPGTGLSDSVGSAVMASPPAPTTYVLHAASPVSGCRVLDTLFVDVHPRPVGVFTVSDTLICIGETVSMSYVPAPSATASHIAALLVPDGVFTGIKDTLVISGGPTIMNGSSIVHVCIDMAHTWASQVSFTLISPSGTALDLCSNNGGFGDNFTGMCFTSGAVTNITAGFPPFTGNWIPEGPGGFNVFNGENSNGNWVLQVVDNTSGETGFLSQWSIEIQHEPFTLSWSSDPVGFSSAAASVTVGPDTTTLYTLTVASSVSGCTAEHLAPIHVNPPISLDYFLPDSANVCPGDSVTLVALASGGDGDIHYAWSPSGVTAGAFTLFPTGESTHIVTVTDGCSTPAVRDTLHIHYVDSIIGNAGPDITICEGGAATLNCTISDGGGIYTYLWSTGETTSSITVSPTVSTSYTCTYSDNCGNIATDGVLVMVNPLPVANFSFSPLDPEAGVPVGFTNTSTGATSYTWNFGGAGSSTAANPSFTFPAVGPTFVQLIATNACGSDTAYVTFDLVVLASQPFGAGSAVVFPNPSNGEFSLAVTGMEGLEGEINLFSMMGQKLHHQKVIFTGPEMVLPFQFGLPAGLYLLELRFGQETVRFNVTISQD
jgi:PKD repeat protein/subtilisin-like proprotein convertase family protein